MAKTNREELLRILEAVAPGLSTRETTEQSTCLAFQGGEAATYNDEVCCRAKTGLPDSVKGACAGKPLLALLGKLAEDEVDIDVTDGQLFVRGKRRRAAFRLEAEISMPLQHVEEPTKWTKLPEGFAEAAALVQTCASRDETYATATCVRIAPDWIEAFSDAQACRWRIKTGIVEPVLAKWSSIKSAGAWPVAEFGLTPNWLHFRGGGVTISCRRYAEDFPDLAPLLACEGKPAMLPKGLAEAADKAALFSGENPEADLVEISLRPGRLTVRGEGISGSYQEHRKLDWQGEQLAFLIAPALLADIVKRHSEVVIGAGKLKVEAGAYTMVACLRAAERNGKAE